MITLNLSPVRSDDPQATVNWTVPALTLRALVAVLLLLALPSLAHAKYESHYQDLWCGERGGEIEVTLYDRSRVDCLLPGFAVEVDFARKWAESIGQALLYAEITGKAPAVLLIVKPDEAHFVARFHNASDGLGIRLFLIDYDDSDEGE